MWGKTPTICCFTSPAPTCIFVSGAVMTVNWNILSLQCSHFPVFPVLFQLLFALPHLWDGPWSANEDTALWKELILHGSCAAGRRKKEDILWNHLLLCLFLWFFHLFFSHLVLSLANWVPEHSWILPVWVTAVQLKKGATENNRPVFFSCMGQDSCWLCLGLVGGHLLVGHNRTLLLSLPFVFHAF